MTETLKRTNCPFCGDDYLSDLWRKDRKLRQECRECDWVGEERIPEQREIVPIRKVIAGYNGGHTFGVFDRYGHILMSSRSYPTADEARAAIKTELNRGRTDKTAGPYTGVLWPATVLVTGELIQ